MIYLDNASTTRLRFEARDAMAAAPFANPSSIHGGGRAARKAIEDARDAIADTYKGDPKGLLFTASATESDNLAIFGVADALKSKGRHIITSAIEHPAVLEACAVLEKQGFTITRLPVDSDGRVDPKSVERAITPSTILISIMWGNNEIGTVQPVPEIAAMAKARGVLFHTDAAQVAGKIAFEFVGDLLTVSSHKMHGPRGAGALYVRPGTPLVPRLFGGGQEFERRAGTENVEAILGFAAAVKAEWKEDARRMNELRGRLEAGLRAASPMTVNGHPTHRLPHILNVTFPGADGEAMVVAMDARGLCVSSGSACASSSLVPSHVLTAMGRSPEHTRASVRFSLGRDTTAAEIDQAIVIVPQVVGRLRSISAVNP